MSFKFILKLKNLIFRNFLKILGLSSICFVFEACYGTPKSDMKPPKLDFKGKVVSADSLKVIPNIVVILTELDNKNKQVPGITDISGNYSITADYINNSKYKLTFEDVDSIQNGSFRTLDTLLNVTSEDINISTKTTDAKMKRK